MRCGAAAEHCAFAASEGGRQVAGVDARGAVAHAGVPVSIWSGFRSRASVPNEIMHR